MTVTSQIVELSAIPFNKQIEETRLQDIYKSLCGSYELCFNDSAPSAGGQTYTGHDHTPSGGGHPIYRGGQWSASGRSVTPDLPLAELSWTSKSEIKPFFGTYGSYECVAYFVPSPGLRAESSYSAWILVRAYYDYTYTISSLGSTRVTITGGGTSPDLLWIQIEIPSSLYFTEGDLEALVLSVSVNGYRAGDPPLFRVYGVSISEVPEQEPTRARSSAPTGANSSLAEDVAQFPPLAQDLVNADEWLDAVALGWAVDSQNTLFSGVFDSTPPSGSTQVCKGHDHATNGGRPVARGRVSTSRSGGFLYATAAVGTTYEHCDKDETDLRSDDGFGTVRGWVSDGITSTGDEPAYLGLYCNVELSAGGLVDLLTLRLDNINSGFTSSEYSVTTGLTNDVFVVNFLDVPCVAGWNEWSLMLKSASGELPVQIISISLCEVPGGVSRSSNPGSSVPR